MSHESTAAAAELREKGRLDEAAAALENILDSDAGDAAALVELGIVRLSQADRAAAEACFRRALEADDSVVAAHFNLARLLMANGQAKEAAAGFESVTRLAPDLAEGHHGLACARAAEGQLVESAAAGRRALELRPEWPEAAAQVVAVAIEAGDLTAAGEVLESWGGYQPNDAEQLFLAGCLAQEKGELEASTGYFEKAISGGCDGDAEARLASVLVRLGRLEAAEAAAHQALKHDPEAARAHNTLGNLAMIGGDPARAEPAFQRACEFEPANPIAWRNLGDALLRQGRHDAARQVFARLANVPNGAAMAHDGNGAVLQTEGRHQEAIASFRQALELDPDFPVALANLGTSLQAGNQLREAATAFERALELRPDMVTAQYNLGSLYLMLHRLEDAADCFARALELRPAAGGLYAYLGYARARLCDWRQWDEIGAQTVRHLESPAAAFEEVVAPPFGLFGLAVPPKLRLEAAQREAVRINQAVAPLKAEVKFSYAPRGQRLRIGYLSPDFRRHSLGRTFAVILAAHDRDRFELHGYSLAGVERHDEVTAALAKDFDSFIELRPFSDREAAERINADQIDILVDLAGPTRGARPGILALEPAPVPVHALGYGNTMGADFIRYLITDEIYTADDVRPFVSETVVELPEGSLPGARLEFPEGQNWRQDFALPAHGRVFANFSLHNKIDPQVFDIWMKILDRTPDSVLWLLAGHEVLENNLRREAGARNVSPDRLIFAPRADHAQHLARQAQADLVLDTLHHTGGVTTAEALWTGLPVLTFAGPPSDRAGEALVTAAGMPELACPRGAFVETAVALGHDDDRLEAIKAKLVAQRDTCPLFDLERFTRHLERAYEMIWQHHESSDPSHRIQVPALPRNGTAS
ncbi:MAG: tetratricopeptide repeat protein [Alphaproteobacteria bacterium]|jgi:predicted O-linked N-acetylglucosamine transferase (SPINDLY family)|nr:hypothetical protein [Rhodospirillaceae bacterium]MDP6405390.1 tetratricopeptide repeat protein [Alphaproteobacteria bacterium]MDP6620720.1 tetratricopeptide repeat protein [Alphaproteobacteria bacterium]